MTWREAKYHTSCIMSAQHGAMEIEAYKFVIEGRS